MSRFLKYRKQKKGLPPGSLVYLSDSPEEKQHEVKITAISYTENDYQERVVSSFEECIDETSDKKTVTWINIEGLSDLKLIEDIGKKFGLHRLWLEDVLNTDHRPKIDEMNDLVFVILKTVHDYSLKKKVFFEQISLFLGENYVLSFQEYPGDVFESVKNRLKKIQGRIRQAEADYLFYALIDSVVDNYFDAIEHLGLQVEGAEKYISKTVDPQTPQFLVNLKHEMLYLAKAALPIKEALSQLSRTTAKEIKEETKTYFKDALEHSVQVVDTIESYKQMLVSLNDFYQSRINHRMNEIMKLLTIFSAIFIPLTFITSLYGMNFENMPELKATNGYYYVLSIITLVAIVMILFIRKRKWF